MIIFCNSKNEIKDVGVNSLSDPTLTEVEIDDTDNPFGEWSNAKICCYKAIVESGKVVMMTPYVDSRIIDHIDQLGKSIEAVTPYMDSKRAYIGDTMTRFENVKGTHITAYCETDNGLSVSTRTERGADNVVTVLFNALDEVATVTISAI